MPRIQRRRAKPEIVIALAIAVAACLASSAAAAGPGIHGRVFALDDGGDIVGVVPGATIELTDQAGQNAGTATSDSRGYYKLDVAPGRYSYKVKATGYKQERAGRGVQLQLSEGYAVYNFSLVGTIRDVVDYDSSTNATTVANHRRFDAFGNFASGGEREFDPDFCRRV